MPNVNDYSPYIAGVVAVINAVLAALSAFGVFTLTPTEKDALAGVFAAGTAAALLFIPIVVHRNALAKKGQR